MATMDPITVAVAQAILPAPSVGFPHLLQVRSPAMFASGKALGIKAGVHEIRTV